MVPKAANGATNTNKVIMDSDSRLSDARPTSDTLLASIQNQTSLGIVVRAGSGTSAIRTIGSTDPQVRVVDGNGVTGNPDIQVEPGFLSASYYHQWFGTDGVGNTGSLTPTGSVTHSIAGTGNFPSATLSVTNSLLGWRSTNASFSLALGLTHRLQFVTGPNKTNVRWRIGLFSTGLTTVLKPNGPCALLVFDPDSGQTNATTNWYLLTYDNGGGSVSYSDTFVACNVDTPYEVEITNDTTHVYGRVRAAGGSWSGYAISTSSLPASGTGMVAGFLVYATTASARTLECRKYAGWKAYT